MTFSTIVRSTLLGSLSFSIAQDLHHETHCETHECVSKDSVLLQTAVASLASSVRKSTSDFGSEEHTELSNAALIDTAADSKITVVSYNLYWWNVKQNNRWEALHNRIKDERPFHLIGFQECEDVASVLHHSGVGGFEFYAGPSSNPAPLAWDANVFSKLEEPDTKWIGRDRWGDRHFNWVRLKHRKSGANVFFANTHGPLGNCDHGLGHNWKTGVSEHKMPGDIVFMTGDFNCRGSTSAMRDLTKELQGGFDGGIDHILTNYGRTAGNDATAWKEYAARRHGYPSDHPLIKARFGLTATDEAETEDPAHPAQCSPVADWPSVEFGVTCGDCTALVLTGPYDGRCDKYCESFAHTCVAAAEDASDDCRVKFSTECHQPITNTHDMLCTCSRQ